MSEDLNAAKIPLEGLIPYKEPKDWPDGDGFRIIDLKTDGIHQYEALLRELDVLTLYRTNGLLFYHDVSVRYRQL
jgi:hypothetical protein